MLDRGTDNPGGAFGAKGDRPLSTIFKGVHLLVDDVAGLADAAVKEFGVLKDRRPDFGEMVKARHLARDAFDGLPFAALGGQYVGRPARRVDLRHDDLVLWRSHPKTKMSRE